MGQNQFIIFDDNGVIKDCYNVDETIVIDIDGATWGGGANNINGISFNFGLLKDGTAKIGDTMEFSELLPVAIATKLIQFNGSCQNTIYSGFDCQPLGNDATYHFPFDTQAQDNYNQYLTDVLCGSTENQAWKVMDSNGNWMTLDLTPDQFKANVRPVASSFKKSQINQYRTLVSQVETAQSLSDIKSVVWTPSTY